MRIFHNDTTNQVIIVENKCAYSFFAYQNDNIIDEAKSYMRPPVGLAGYEATCEEIEIPDQTTPEPKHIIEKPTDQIGQNFHKKTYKELKCEHSQKKNNQP